MRYLRKHPWRWAVGSVITLISVNVFARVFHDQFSWLVKEVSSATIRANQAWVNANVWLIQYLIRINNHPLPSMLDIGFWERYAAVMLIAGALYGLYIFLAIIDPGPDVLKKTNGKKGS
jgi:hypothetical protein